jgi:hypothetical protein
MTSFLALVLETVDFTSLDGAKASSPKSGEEVINKFQVDPADPEHSAACCECLRHFIAAIRSVFGAAELGVRATRKKR